ncbi:Mediator of RNA polymerase II transcription subunit 6 [Hypsizygus marmoreus]|uniref:Mediator of RNA polymerase II transcription subunit 6 n=1 Tax=Hypsizygus marmoreus TaxID=39966 RepID=A0A369K1B9_HYPMA|nr:Mediator of RNA polymerase II transcription subunit 6 [Hypsizygus marmoreus]
MLPVRTTTLEPFRSHTAPRLSTLPVILIASSSMDINDLHPPDDYSHRFFIWHEWIQANGPLTTENVFDYFATSMFYDKQSNNQVLRMQTIHTGMPILNEAEELKRFTGVEFALVHAQPPSMFIIQKRERLSPEEVRPLAAYFIMNNRIYQSPDVYTVLSNRLLTSLHSLQSSLDILRVHRPDYTPRTGFVWPITDPSLPVEAAKKRTTGEDIIIADESGSTLPPLKSKYLTEAPKRQQNNMLLLNAMRATAAHSKMSLPLSTFASNLESVPSETPVAHQRSSATPGPSSSQGTTPKVVQSAPTPQEPVKAPPGGGKKKRKRTSLAAPSVPG